MKLTSCEYGIDLKYVNYCLSEKLPVCNCQYFNYFEIFNPLILHSLTLVAIDKFVKHRILIQLALIQPT